MRGACAVCAVGPNLRVRTCARAVSRSAISWHNCPRGYSWTPLQRGSAAFMCCSSACSWCHVPLVLRLYLCGGGACPSAPGIGLPTPTPSRARCGLRVAREEGGSRDVLAAPTGARDCPHSGCPHPAAGCILPSSPASVQAWLLAGGWQRHACVHACWCVHA